MKEPYYMIDFNAAGCMFEFRVNDQPVLTMNLKGQASTRIPINRAISTSGKQEVSVKILPLKGNTSLSPKAELSYTIKLFNTEKGFELIEEFKGFESKEVEDKVIPVISNTSFFDAETPYQLKDNWKTGEDIEDVDNYNERLRGSYRKIIEIIKSKNFDLLSKMLENREFNMSTSMYLDPKAARKRITSLIGDLDNGYDHVLFSENAFPIISAYGKKVALMTPEGDPALAFGNKELQEQLMLDIEFYYNKETNDFEII